MNYILLLFMIIIFMIVIHTTKNMLCIIEAHASRSVIVYGVQWNGCGNE